MSEEEEGVLQTLTRGLAVLDLIAASDGVTTAKEIGDRLDLKIGTVYHLLRTLRTADYVTRVDGGSYDIGPAGTKLGRHLDLRAAPNPEISALLSRLNQRTHETSYVMGWYHGTMILQQFLSGTGAVQVANLGIGYSGMYHARASCKSMLAYLPEGQVAALFSGVELEALTPHTLTSYPALQEQLAEISRRGYAIDHEEFALGVCCISAPFFNRDDKPVGSFSVTVPANQFASVQENVARAVIEVANLATNMYHSGRLSVPAQLSPAKHDPVRRRPAFTRAKRSQASPPSDSTSTRKEQP